MITMSFSQAAQWRRCKRSWSFSKVDKIKGIPSLAAIRGTRYHQAIEIAARKNEKPFAQGQHQLTGEALTQLSSFDYVDVEVLLEETLDDVHVRGYADVVAKTIYDYADDDNGNSGYVYGKTVVDWKFPVKDPGDKAKPDHISQVNFYGYLSAADKGIVAYPEHNRYFKFQIDHDAGETTFDKIVETGREIRDSGAYEVSGFDQEATHNYLCKEYCSYRHICPLGGK